MSGLKASLSVAQDLLWPAFSACTGQSAAADGSCDDALQASVLRRAQLRVAGALVSELPLYSAPDETDFKPGAADGAHCPCEALPSHPAVLGGASISPGAVQEWYRSHGYCLMCNAHAGGPCSMPYYLYNAHRAVLDSMVQHGSRHVELQGSPKWGQLMLALGSHATIGLWMTAYLATSLSTCHTHHAAQVFNQDKMDSSDALKELYSGLQVAGRVVGLEGGKAAQPSAPSPPPTDYLGATLRRAHRDLLVDMSVVEAATVAVGGAQEALDAGQGEAGLLRAAVDSMPPFLAKGELGTCAMLVDIAANLRDAVAVRGAGAGGVGVLKAAYAEGLAAQLGEEAFHQPSAGTEEGDAPEVLAGTAAPSCGVYIDTTGQLRMPPPCFSCPASSAVLLQDIWTSIEALKGGE